MSNQTGDRKARRVSAADWGVNSQAARGLPCRLFKCFIQCCANSCKRGCRRLRSGLAGLLLSTLPLPALSGSPGLPASLFSWVQNAYGAEARDRVEAWSRLLARAASLPERRQLEAVNDFFNRVPYLSDSQTWGREDYWATPVEMLAEDAADCEDYAIAKYYTLRQLGVAEDKLRIAYVKALNLDQAHMVLTYYPTPEAVPLVLDNLQRRIERATERTDLKPVYSFNGDGLWLAVSRAEGRRVGDATRIKLWQNLLTKLGLEMAR